MLKKNVETFLGCDAEYAEAKIVLFGAPFDSTTSFRPGARFASAAMRRESYGLELYSPYQDRELTDAPLFDSGDIELCFGDSARALDDIRARAAHILADGKLPFLIGGEHLVTLGAVRAAAERYPDLHILHFDAHADLRDDYLGAPLSRLERRFPMAFVPVPKDLNRVKTKVMFNLTKRQLICFALAAAAGVPIFFLTKPSLGISTSAMLMVVIMLPFIFFALYEKDGQPAEKILGHVIKSMFLRDKVRPYRTSNLYAAIQQEIKEKEELQIAQQHEKGRRT